MRSSRFIQRARGRRRLYGLLFVAVVLLPVAGLPGDGSLTGRSPIRSATTPPSAYEDSAVTTPDPVDDTGNLIVTGNVRGGKQLRAPVPYTSSTSFQDRLGSTSLDSFRRLTAPPRASRSTSTARSDSAFYSPTGTVATGASSDSVPAFKPVSPRVGDPAPPMRAELQPSDLALPNETTQSQAWTSRPRIELSDHWKALGKSTKQPLSNRTAPTDSPNVPAQLPVESGQSAQRPDTFSMEDYEKQVERIEQKLARMEAGLAVGERKPAGADKVTARPGASDLTALDREFDRSSLPPSLQLPTEPRPSRTSSVSELMAEVAREPGLRLYRRSEPGLDGAGAIPDPLEESLGTRTGDDELWQVTPHRAERTTDEAGTLPAERRVNETAHLFDTTASGLSVSETLASAGRGARSLAQDRMGLGTRSGGTSTSLNNDFSARAQRRRQAMLDAAGRAVGPEAEELKTIQPEPAQDPQLIGDRVLQKYEKQGALSGGFDRYMKQAQSALQQKRYYRAAEAYGMALLYRPSDAGAHLGRGLALFAAGEYLSSALSLARAIELNPQRALRSTDLIGTVGGPVAFEGRLADLEKCVRDNGTAQLHFLLAYIYQQTGQLQEAQAAIDAAHKQLPGAPAIDMLRTVLTR